MNVKILPTEIGIKTSNPVVKEYIDRPSYNGPYFVNPADTAQTFETNGKRMTNNFTVGAVDYTDLMAAIAPTYSSSMTYAVGSYAWYNGALYRCTTKISTPEIWNSSHWTASPLYDLVWRSCALRGNLTASDDMDSVIVAGYYFKDNGVTVTNGVNAYRARILCFNGAQNTYGLVQVWFDTYENTLYYRTKNTPSSQWTSWTRIQTELKTTVNLKLSEVSVYESTGKWSSGIANFGHIVSSRKPLELHGARMIDAQWTKNSSQNSAFSIVFLGADDAHISHASYSSETITGISVPTGAKYVSVNIYNTEAKIPNPNIELTFYGTNTVTECAYQDFGSNGDDGWYRFGYKVADGVYNTGKLMFPPNYTRDGTPVPVIVMVHGSEAYLTMNGAELSSYKKYYEYLRDCGYALIDCYGWTSKYGDQSGLHNPWPIPITEKAYEALLELMLDCFNLDGKNVFVLCKSLGGRVAEWLATKPYVKAAAFLAPALALNFGYASSLYRSAMVADMGLTGVANSDLGWATPEDCLADFVNNYRSLSNSSWPNSKREAFYLHNEQEIIGVDPEFINLTGGSAQDKLSNSANNDWSSGTFGRVAFSPTKVWVAMDDTSISPAACLRFAQQIRNGGGYGVARIMPNGTGGHHSVDSDANALQKENLTTPLGIEYASVPLAYYEVWEFYEKFRTRNG